MPRPMAEVVKNRAVSLQGGFGPLARRAVDPKFALRLAFAESSETPRGLDAEEGEQRRRNEARGPRDAAQIGRARSPNEGNS